MQEVSADEIGRLTHYCPLLWDFTGKKQYHNRANRQNSWSAGGDPLENPIGKEQAEWDFAPYMDILPDGTT